MATAPAIDIHAHYFPESFLKLIADHGKPSAASIVSGPGGARFIQVGLLLRTGPVTSAFIDLDEHLKEMDRQGCDMHVLSLTQPMVYWADDDLGMKLSVAFTDAASEAHRAHPERLLGFAVLPMQNPRLALEELERAAKLSDPAWRISTAGRSITSPASIRHRFPVLKTICAFRRTRATAIQISRRPRLPERQGSPWSVMTPLP